jgi:tRNA U34 5-methylaminomethyl-2-thiouridine-forming methyltransferase MnmC
MMTSKRTIVATRRTLGETLQNEFRPLEESADATAAKGFRFLALTLEQRAAAAMPVIAGETAIDLLYSACQRAYEAQAQLRQAHALWPAIAEQTGLLAPECDPKGADEAVSLKIVA